MALSLCYEIPLASFLKNKQSLPEILSIILFKKLKKLSNKAKSQVKKTHYSDI